MKFPKVKHLPYSEQVSKDDKRLRSDKCFLNKEIIITEKMDGSNTCMTKSNLFARSHSCTSPKHPSFNFAKVLYNRISYRIPENIYIFGEYCYAIHSIVYENLSMINCFLVFAVWSESYNYWWTWNDTENLAKYLGFNTVPILFKGSVCDLKGKIKELMKKESKYGNEIEGIVIRIYDSFDNFDCNIAKFVRKDHKSDENWLRNWRPQPFES